MALCNWIKGVSCDNMYYETHCICKSCSLLTCGNRHHKLLKCLKVLLTDLTLIFWQNFRCNIISRIWVNITCQIVVFQCTKKETTQGMLPYNANCKFCFQFKLNEITIVQNSHINLIYTATYLCKEGNKLKLVRTNLNYCVLGLVPPPFFFQRIILTMYL